MAQIKRWTFGLALCFLLVASKASATYVVIENISQNAPNWDDCNCHQATGWLGFITMGCTVVESDGTTYDLILQSSDYYSRPTVAHAGNFFLLDVTHGAKTYASFRGITPSRIHDSRTAVSR